MFLGHSFVVLMFFQILIFFGFTWLQSLLHKHKSLFLIRERIYCLHGNCHILEVYGHVTE